MGRRTGHQAAGVLGASGTLVDGSTTPHATKCFTLFALVTAALQPTPLPALSAGHEAAYCSAILLMPKPISCPSLDHDTAVRALVQQAPAW